MKKIKYLLFIIPLLFIFIGNSKAYDILTCGDIVINEQILLTDFETYFPNEFDDTYVYFSCFKHPNQDLQCYSFDDTVYNSLTYGGFSSNTYNLYGITSVGHVPLFIQYNRTTCIKNSSYTIGGNMQLRYYIPYEVNSRFFVSNFSTSLLNNNVSSSNFYEYDLLNFSSEPEPEEPTIENKIYLPDELEDGSCPIVLNQGTIRVYEEEPQLNTPVNYTDYFLNSHYIKQNGTETLTNTITCLDLDNFTTSYVYRFDFHQIIVIFIGIVLIIGYPLMKIIHSFFIGFKRR